MLLIILLSIFIIGTSLLIGLRFFKKNDVKSHKEINCTKYRAIPINHIKRGLIVFKGCHHDDDVSFDVVMSPIKFCAKEIVKIQDVDVEELGEC